LGAVFAAWIAAATGALGESLSDLEKVATLNLKGTLYHVQGVVVDEQHIWVSSVDSVRREGHLAQFSRSTQELERDVIVGDHVRFHPGGIAGDTDSIWVPVAEYRPRTSAVIERRSKRTLELLSSFRFADHIGCVAVAPGLVVGGNWDSREFYVWDLRGHLVRRFPNGQPTRYQDMKFLGDRLVASGPLSTSSGAIDWLEWPSMRLGRQILGGKTDRNMLYNREAMAIDAEFIYLLPEDGPSRLFIFRYPAPNVP
jgi:hypothetical protein